MMERQKLFHSAWKEVLVLILFAGIAIGKKCSIDNIKSGFSLRNGFDSNNVKLLGDGIELEGCKRLCCKLETFQYGLFDGNKCFGIQCMGNADTRCMLTEDGNAVYTIFSLKREEPSSDLNDSSKEQKKIHKSKSRNKHKHKSAHKHYFEKNEETVQQNSKSKNTNHRKHKKKRRHHSKKHRNTDHTARDYPFEYFQTPLWRLTNKRTNSNIQGLTRTNVPQNQYYNMLSKQYGVNQPLTKYNAIQGYPNTYAPYQMASSNYQQFVNPYINTNKNFQRKDFLAKGILKSNQDLPAKNTSSTKYVTKFDIMAGTQKKNVLANKTTSLTKNNHEIVKKTNIPLIPKTEESNENGNAVKPLASSIQTKKEKDQVMSQINVEPLTEFSTDNDTPHNIVDKDAIPRPEDFEPKEPSITPRDSIVDVPFSSTVEPLKTAHGFLAGLSVDHYRKLKLFLSSQSLQSSPSPSPSPATITPSPSPATITPPGGGKQPSLPSKVYSMLFPLSTIQRESFQKMFLERCLNPIGVGRPHSVPDSSMTASSAMEGYPSSNGRLKMAVEDDGGSWCASKTSVDNNAADEQYLSIDFGHQAMFCRLGTQGYSRGKKWVDNFKVEFSDDGKYWEPYRENGDAKIFYGNHDEKDVTFQTLKNPIMARFIKFVPIRWTGDVPCLRVEVFNTSMSKVNDNYHTRSDIPKADSTLLEDIGFEKMDETVALDRSTYGNNGLLYGGSKVIDTHGSCRHGVEIPLGGDIVFDGSVMGNHPRQAITIASWVRLNRVGGVHSIFDTVGSHSSHNLGQFHFEVVGGDVRWFHRNETGDEVFSTITGEKVIKPDTWNHIAVTYDSRSGYAIIYINGTESARSKGHGLLSSDWNNRVGIGRHKGSRFLDGAVDEFKLYGEALQNEAIEDLYKKCDFSKYYCGSTLTDYTGTIVSPGFPATFNGPVDCTWNIHGQPGEIIVMDISQFKLGDKSTCGKANFEIRDGINDTVLGTFCGAALTPKKIMSHSNRMYVRYTTDGALPGENFKVEYYREKKRTAKKTISDECRSTKTLSNVTLIGGTKSGKFKPLGTTADMDVCKQRCCHSGECDVAFLIGNNCYSVKCYNKDLCGVRKAKPSNLNPQLAFVSSNPAEELLEPVVEELPEDQKASTPVSASTTATTSDPSASVKSTGNDPQQQQQKQQCSHQPVMNNVTLTGGIKSGKFKSHGHVEDMSACIQHCCDRDDCDLAFMVKNTCFSLHCTDDNLCRSKPAKPSAFHPMVAYMTKYKPQLSKTETGTTKGDIATSTTTTGAKNDESKCKDMRVSKVFNDVTLTGGINSGDFTDKGHVGSIDECVTKCCDTDTCNVAFVIKNTCFLVKCKSYKECGLKSAVSDYYSPKIAYINWNPPKELDDSVPYTYRGCWRDFDITAFAMPLMEGTDPKLSEPYKKRSDPVNTCSRVAQDRGYKIFAVQNGGACFSGPDGDQTFKRYGKSEACKNGKGGPFANNVYKTFEDGSVIGMGCWADLKDRAFRRMEKNDPQLRDSFQQRSDPIGACAKVAEKLKVPYFALQKGGQCFVGKSSSIEYDRYSPSRKCKYGLGGQMANDVYMLKKNFTSDNPTITTDVKTSSNNTSVASQPSETSSSTTPVANVTDVQPQQSTDVKQEPTSSTANVTDVTVANATTSSISSSDDGIKKYDDDDVHLGENVYREEIAGDDVIKYIYKADEPLSNVTLKSAINAGKFDDKGKVDSINDCIKMCGENPGCDVAFMLSSQCFTVHCQSGDSCQTKPAFSNFYKPQLAYVKHRSIKKHKNATASRTSLPSAPCTVKTELSNVTFIEGINSGNFTDMGHVLNFGECKQKCCDDKRCNIAFKIQEDCYGVTCHSRKSCRTRPAKNANVFSPEMALMRTVNEESMEETPQKPIDTASTSAAVAADGPSDKPVAVATKDITPETSLAEANAVKKHESPKIYNNNNTALSAEQDKKALDTGTVATNNTTSTPLSQNAQCLNFGWDNKVIFNQTLVGGINAGDFKEHGQAESMKECMNHCCSEQDCDLSFMIDRDCYTVKCYNPSLCKTRPAKTTSFVPRIAFKTKSNVVTGISEALDFVKDTISELTLDQNDVVRPFKVLYQGLVDANKPTVSITSSLPSITSSSPTSSITSSPLSSSSRLTVNNAVVRSNTTTTITTDKNTTASEGAIATPVVAEPKKHSCDAGKIIYNATLRLGMHSGMFTKLGRVNSMDDCIERCCRSSNADVAYKLGSFCFAVKCKTRDLCKPSPTMFSDITSLNLNPAISFLNEDKIPLSLTDDSEKDTLGSVYTTSVNSDDLINAVVRNLTKQGLFHVTKPSNAQRHKLKNPTLINDIFDDGKTTTTESDFDDGDSKSGLKTNEGACSDSPITYNVTLRGGVHAGKFTQLGHGIGMRECVGRCCNTPLCDVAFMFSDKCYSVACFNENDCQAVLAKPSSLSPKLAYVSKSRGSFTPSTLTDGVEFKLDNEKNENMCSAEKVKHGPVYSNKTLMGGMKAGNFSYLGKASDINHCLSKCCTDGGCDVAYLVNRDQCFSVKCFTPELCQVTDKLFNNRNIEIAKLIKPEHRRAVSRGLLAAYFAVGLLCTVVGVAGFLWAALIFKKRNELKMKNLAKQAEIEFEGPRPDR